MKNLSRHGVKAIPGQDSGRFVSRSDGQLLSHELRVENNEKLLFGHRRPKHARNIQRKVEYLNYSNPAFIENILVNW